MTAVYWVSEAVPLGAAALVPAFLYPFFGVLRSNEVRPLVASPLLGPCWAGEGRFHKALEEGLLSPSEPLLKIKP